MVVSLAGACGGGGGDPVTPNPSPAPTPTPTPVIDLTIGTAPSSIVSGTEATVALTIARTNTSGDVVLSTENVPAGVTATITSATLTNPSTTATLRLVVAAGTTAGNVTITVRARSTGASDVVRTVSVAITDPPPTPEIRVALTPASVTVQQGKTATVSLSLTRLGGFSGAVTLSLATPPADLGAALSSTSVSGASADVTLAPTFNMSTGTLTFDVVASAAGVTTQRATLTVVVTGATFTGSLATNALTIAAGAQQTVALTLDRTGGYTGAITASIDSLPVGIAASVAPSTITGTSAVVTVSVAASRAAGVVTVVVRLRAVGQPDRTLSITVTVPTPAVADSTIVSYCGSGAESVPTFFAVQDGAAGTWRRITMTGNTARFLVAQPVVSVLYTFVGNGGDGNSFFVSYTRAEMQTFAAASCRLTDARTRDFSVNVAGLLANEFAIVSGGQSNSATLRGGGTATLRETVSGATDLVAVSSTSPNTSYFLPERVRVLRNINPALNSVVSVNLRDTASRVLDSALVTVTGASTPFYWMCELISALNSSTLCSTDKSAVTTRMSYGLPSALLATGDLLHVAASEESTFPAAEFVGRTRSAEAYVRSPRVMTLSYGPDVAVPTIAVGAAGSPARLRVQASWDALYNRDVQFYMRSATVAGPALRVLISAGARSSASSVDWTMPDVAGIGFQSAWFIARGSTDIVITPTGSSGAAADGTPIDGTRWWSATRSGTVAW